MRLTLFYVGVANGVAKLIVLGTIVLGGHVLAQGSRKPWESFREVVLHNSRYMANSKQR
jgi:hypothetical protein